ncbi:MAG: hypothetical protein KZQ58_04525 [gamma proteobacterium symbiont of Bathyaustriella thionipta]|nr:hypothetical protein [gamma proteobacterium symbiont of Bathyaustriella thionipta]
MTGYGNPLAALLLIGMDMDHLSMNVASLLPVKWLVRNISKAHARTVLQSALQCDDSECVRKLVRRELEQLGLSRLLHPQAGHHN